MNIVAKGTANRTLSSFTAEMTPPKKAKYKARCSDSSSQPGGDVDWNELVSEKDKEEESQSPQLLHSERRTKSAMIKLQ